MSAVRPAFEWDFEWRLTLVTALLLPGLIALGFWQLDRAEEKEMLAQRQAMRAVAPAQPLAELPVDAGDSSPLSRDTADAALLAFRTAEVSGYFHLEALVLRDNQLRDGRYGVDVLGLFFDRPSDRWVLLNRGWVPADPARRTLPDIAIPEGDFTLIANVYVPPGEPYTLGEERFEALSWPVLVQDPGAEALHRALESNLGGTLFPFALRLQPDQPTGFRRDWPLMNSSPARHRGYALQWFTMAAALLLLFLLRSSNLVTLLRRSDKS